MNTRQGLYHAFRQAARDHAGRIAVHDVGPVTYAQLEAQSRIAARGLMAAGIARGDKVLIWAGNRLEWIVAALAIQAAGCVLVLASTRLRGREVAELIERTGATTLFCDPGFGDYDFVRATGEHALPTIRQIVAFDDRAASGKVCGWPAFLARAGEISDAELDARIALSTPDDLADIIFTSGTTGKPKGVPMTHEQSLIACAAQDRYINRFVPGEVIAVLYPFAHNAGYRAGWQVGLLCGLIVVPVRATDPVSIMSIIAERKVNVLPAAPPIVQAILDHPERPRFDLSSLRYASTGATMIPVRLIERMLTELGAQQVATGYGLTEAAGSVSNTQPDSSPETIAKTTGQVIGNLAVKLIDVAGDEVANGEAGEIVVKGPQVMRGYFNDAEATARAFTPDGFLRTGDVGVFDADGNLRITDRIKDMYLIGGFNCYPAEIEQVLLQMPGVSAVAVIGIADERLGEVGRAFVVPQHGFSIDADAIIVWSRLNMANYKVPRSVILLDALPLNATGKVNKNALRSSS